MVADDHKLAAQPRNSPGGDLAVAAQHGGTVVASTTAPSHTSAARGREAKQEVRRGVPGLAGGEGNDHRNRRPAKNNDLGRPGEEEKIKSPRCGCRGARGGALGINGGDRDNRDRPGFVGVCARSAMDHGSARGSER